MNVLIRADGNEKIGSGHIMRTKSIAAQLKGLGAKVLYALADERGKRLINGEFESVVLSSNYECLDDEKNALSSVIKEQKIKLILLDSYFVTPKYFKELKKLAKVAYIDDLDAFAYECEALINYGAFFDKNEYKARQNLAKKHFLGSEFAPLRAEFYSTQKSSKNTQKKQVLLTTGNTDLLGIMPRLLEAFLSDESLKNLEFLAISGAFNEHENKLLALSAKHKNIKVLKSPENMAQIMVEADFVLSAGGSTLYELASLAKAVICFSIAANQNNIKSWAEAGAMLYAGDAKADSHSVVARSVNLLKSLLNDENLAKTLGQKAHFFVDGKGAIRLAKKLLSL
ncbi:UDP-2,4-diacetamido-2,4,6-trideoxy-beta-L-altropyranose hydrolase [Campylobacter magnus]|uniref:UDP-2,4-diacetamido-2,4, 6-trideoxy-beta-L-altropyranose hydrolase n=1 Tax=Campylobacter magnus TaxID=3026462 RepID=UPI0026DEE77D|nr:UDP-2,4-diacetamido-2,4,6-trideoxy-beta-L-altropyranose hydrolase [Campylobacter magnus]MDO2407912.1 UDP-2,4-diacetamido-2,4,6-trideoxy-beta-L-altropyranose hydrolase [Campylobacter magnus]